MRSFENIDDIKSAIHRHPSVDEFATPFKNGMPRDSGDTAGLYEGTSSNNRKNKEVYSIISGGQHNQGGGLFIADSFQEMQVSEQTPADSEPAELVTTPLLLSSNKDAQS